MSEGGGVHCFEGIHLVGEAQAGVRIVDIGNIGSRARVTVFKIVPFS